MKNQPNFEIKSNEIISKKCIENGIYDFENAMNFIKNLPYKRNLNKKDLSTLFSDGCGTCSTKHALLKTLATENNFDDIKLIIGLFKMNKINTPEIAKTLQQNQIEYIPEAHCYLKYKGEIIDCTKQKMFINFDTELIEEIEITPNQITDYKVNYQKNYIQNWLKENPQINFSLDEFWEIREQCIQNFSENSNW